MAGRTPHLILVLAVLLVAGLALSPAILPKTAEVQVGMVIVVAVSALITLVFIMAAGFQALGLATERQALGLPQGSVRAMIALFLILIFVILSLYLFTTVAEDKGGTTSTFEGLTTAQVVALGFNVEEIKPNEAGTFDGKIRHGLPTEGRQLAQQLVTILGTLAAAVSAFYFGTTSVAGARAAITQRPAPTISRIEPSVGKQNDQIELRVFGSNLQLPSSVRLVRASEQIVATGVLASSGEVRGKVLLDKQPGDKWQLEVQTEDGPTARLADAFIINPP